MFIPADFDFDEGYSPTDDLAEVLAAILDDPNPLDAFNDVILDRGSYWEAQQDICAALSDPDVSTVVVPAGHSVGKSYLAAGVILGWLSTQPDALVMSTSPSNTQLSGVLWKEIRRARSASPILSRIGRITKLPNNLDLGDGWQALGFSTNQAERLQGFHASSGGRLMIVVDEASGIVDPDIWATLRSLKADKMLLIANPLHAHGYFYDQCRRSEDDPSVRMIRIPSTDSPDIHLEKSPRNLADKAWLREMIADYGEDSQMYRVRVRAMFPDDSADALIPAAWLDRCAVARHVQAGPRRISVDLALGKGGDKTVILVRDDNGILDFEASNRMSLETTSSRVALKAQRYGVESHRISYDFEGMGVLFSALLKQDGLESCRGYRGGTLSKGAKYHDLRTAAHWLMRQRLNPGFLLDGLRPQVPFAIPAAYLAPLRAELREVTIGLDNKKRNMVRPGTEVRAALRRSPDFTDTFAQSFAYPNG